MTTRGSLENLGTAGLTTTYTLQARVFELFYDWSIAMGDHWPHLIQIWSGIPDSTMSAHHKKPLWDFHNTDELAKYRKLHQKGNYKRHFTIGFERCDSAHLVIKGAWAPIPPVAGLFSSSPFFYNFSKGRSLEDWSFHKKIFSSSTFALNVSQMPIKQSMCTPRESRDPHWDISLNLKLTAVWREERRLQLKGHELEQVLKKRGRRTYLDDLLSVMRTSQ